MSELYNIDYLRDEVARIIAPTISMRRNSQLTSDDTSNVPPIDAPPQEWEVEEFLMQCPFDKAGLSDAFIAADEDEIALTDHEFQEFKDNVESWSETNTWLGADDWPIVTSSGDLIFSSEFRVIQRDRYDAEELQSSQLRVEIGRLSPSFTIYERILQQGIQLETLHWREFEELIANLLRWDGYEVELGPGQKDGGTDIVAIKDLGKLGLFKAVWQAKKLKLGNKVGISVIRELADVRQEQKASKGIIVTSTYLTRAALHRVRRDLYTLEKVDRDDLMKWIDDVLKRKKL